MSGISKAERERRALIFAQERKNRIKTLSNADLLHETLLSATSLYSDDEYSILEEELERRLESWIKAVSHD
jgi:hypothetical protein